MKNITRVRRGLLAFAAVCLMAVHAPTTWAYAVCTTVVPDAPANNLAPVPTGEVDNLAHEVTSVDLPTTGVIGPSNLPPPNGMGVYKSLKWGPVSWKDPTRDCKDSKQQFDFWPPAAYQEVADGVVYPTIVYFHPNGVNNHFDKDSTIYLQVAKPAHDLGFHFLSVEFRHPVSDEYLAETPGYNGQVPHQDAGLFLRLLHEKAAQLKVDTRNIFVFGHSRGTLALWQALQPDAPGQASHQVAGFVGYQSQTSYGCDVFSQRYLVQDSVTAAFVQQCHVEHSHDGQFGDAVLSVKGGITDRTKLPVMLQYEKPFYLELGSQTQVKRITVTDMDLSYGSPDKPGSGSVHYPNFGIALFNQYNAVGIDDSNALMSRPQEGVLEGTQFSGWQAFVAKYRKP